MKCPICQTISLHFQQAPGLYTQHNPACLYCGARLIQRIQKYRIPGETKRERLRATLSMWMQYGHSELELRRLGKQTSWAVEPKGKK